MLMPGVNRAIYISSYKASDHSQEHVLFNAMFFSSMQINYMSDLHEQKPSRISINKQNTNTDYLNSFLHYSQGLEFSIT